MEWNTFSQERTQITREIFRNYHFNSGIAITRDRYFINHCSDRLKQLHYEFGCLVLAHVPPKGEEDYMRELCRVREDKNRV